MISVSKSLGFLLFFCCFFFAVNNNGVQASHEVYPELQSISIPPNGNGDDDVYKPRYHFRPRSHWLNDPNGPMYYNGTYHLFYQYNPKGAVWGNIVWGHSVSKDLINWKSVKHALVPSEPFDIKGVWSGSITVLPKNRPVIVYTGVDAKNRQVQNYVFPQTLKDPYLQTWIKAPNNPLIVPESGMNASQFRHPTTAWLGPDGYWRILVGGVSKKTGVAYLYRSKDFRKWSKTKEPLHSAPNTGMWECPDFYPVLLNGTNGLDNSVSNGSIKHVLKVSLDLTRYEYYTVGKYVSEQDTYIPDKTSEDGWGGLRYDYGNFYASKSFFDPATNRRIIWGWANESDTTDDDVAKGWAGLQAIPRTVWLDSNQRQLVQWPVKELETLRSTNVGLKNQVLKKGEKLEVKGITVTQADVEVTFSLPNLDKAEPFDPKWVDAKRLCEQKGSQDAGAVGPFGLLTLASKNLEEYTPVFFRIFKAPSKHVVLMCSDARNSSLKNAKGMYKPAFAGFVDVDLSAGKLPLRTLIDHSVVESFGAGGRTCITSRVYPTLAVKDNARLFVFNTGSETVTVERLDAWSLKNTTLTE